jgi:hypothetical protein
MCEDIESDIQVREPVIERLVGIDTGKDHSAWSKVPQPLHLGLPLHFSARTGFLHLLQLWVNKVVVTCVVIPSDCNPTEDAKIKH